MKERATLANRFTVNRPLAPLARDALIAASGQSASVIRGGSLASPLLPVVTTVARAALPVLRSVGEAILAGGVSALAQRALERRNGMAIGGLSGGGRLPQLRPPRRSRFMAEYDPSWQGPVWRPRRRSMNVCNAKALSRALRRLEGFEKIAKRYLKVMGTGKTTAGFKKKRCK